MTEARDLLAALDLEQIERNIFRGHVPPTPRSRVFGGLVVAQALVAAARTVEGRAPHSLHAYFVLPGDPTMPIVYEVERVRDGRSFTTRRCVALQNGRPIFDLFASFQTEEHGLEHQTPMPDVPDPETLPNQVQLLEILGTAALPGFEAWATFEKGVDIRPCSMRRFNRSHPPEAHEVLWMRSTTRLPSDPTIHRAVLAYLSDLSLIDVAFAAHGRTLFEPGLSAASLDHALWFHRPLRPDEWFLYVQDSPNTSGGRGLARGLIYDHAGHLCASVAQEGLIRVLDRGVG